MAIRGALEEGDCCGPVGAIGGLGVRPVASATVNPCRAKAFSCTAPSAARGEGCVFRWIGRCFSGRAALGIVCCGPCSSGEGGAGGMLLSCCSAVGGERLCLSGGALLGPGPDVLGDPAPHIVPFLLSAEHCVAEGLCSPPDVLMVMRGLVVRMFSCRSAGRGGGLRLSGCAELVPGPDCSSGPAQHITFFLCSTECCVARGLCSPLDGRGVV